ncbi:expressed unknown protein [Seminavis robusta]|uniref:Uncharacterized protein n=1 Tax=Seminavis robusta TaxID=568900 RepID=A0A9N8E5E9_9STRA|nr:expressed unknown protein [Seminavis robusta]|eukprot:Sro518_g158760.1 n/a (308) ;mRNA; r:14128-15051
MMKAVTFLTILGSALAAPAVVWQKNGSTEGPVRTSKALKAHSLFSDVLHDSSESSVIFVWGRGADGSESLSTMASAGGLPNVQQKYLNANAIHHHVTGLESPDTVQRDAARAGSSKVMSVSLGELDVRLSSSPKTAEMEVGNNGALSKAQKYSHKRQQQMLDANVLIVNIGARADPATVDAAVEKTIDHDSIANVVLTAVRSHEEVKHERLMEHNRRLSIMKENGRTVSRHGRRLEDQDQDGENNQNNNGGDDMTGVYYVSMTPNILAGLLFTLLFIVIAFTGVSCMGMIAGQDVYVKKMPPVGREA